MRYRMEMWLINYYYQTDNCRKHCAVSDTPNRHVIRTIPRQNRHRKPLIYSKVQIDGGFEKFSGIRLVFVDVFIGEPGPIKTND